MTRRVLPAGDHYEYATLNAFLELDSYPPGILTVHHGGLPIDILHDPRGLPVTAVYFNAAITNPKLTFPFFSGAGVSGGLNSNRIHIHDPSLYINGGLKLAWYAGSLRQPSLQDAITQIIQALVQPRHRVVTFGSSGGGFAALYYASRLENATAVAVNPQTDISRYNSKIVARYAEVAWGITSKEPLSRVPAEMSLIEIYRRRVNNGAWYIQNRGDESHMQEHLAPFLEAAHPENDVKVVLVDAGVGHVPPPKQYIGDVLSAAVSDDEYPPQPQV